MNTKSKTIFVSVAVLALIICALAPAFASSEASNEDTPTATFREELNFAKYGAVSAAAINEAVSKVVCEYNENTLTFKESVILEYVDVKESKIEQFISFEDKLTSKTYNLVIEEGKTVTIKMSGVEDGSVPKMAINIGYDKKDVAGQQIVNIYGKGTLKFELSGYSIAILGSNLNIKDTTIVVTDDGKSKTSGFSLDRLSIDGSKVTITVCDGALTTSSASTNMLKVSNTKNIVLKATGGSLKWGALSVLKTDFPSGQTFRVADNLEGKNLKNYDNKEGYKYADFGDEIKSEGFPTWAIILIVVIVVVLIAAAVYFFYYKKKEGA